MDYLSIPEEQLPVIYGSLKSPIVDTSDALHHFRYLLNDLYGVKEKFFRLGFHLSEFRKYNYFLDLGFSSLEEFALVNLNLDKTAVSRCISVYQAFNAGKDVTYCGNLKTNGAGISISEKYKDYSYSQLVEMVSMDPDTRNLCTPDMTVMQLRDLKKNSKKTRETFTDNEDVSQVATSQQGFDMKKFNNLHGAARYAYVKNAPVKGSILLELFYNDGTPVPVLNNLWVEFIGFDSLGSGLGRGFVARVGHNLDSD